MRKRTSLAFLVVALGCPALAASVELTGRASVIDGDTIEMRAMKPAIEPVVKQPGGDLPQRAVIANVRANVQRLHDAKPILAEMVATGKLRVIGAVYDLATP